MAEANDAYAKSVGFEKGEQLAGTLVRDFLPPSAPENTATVKELVRSKYNIINAETVESYKEGVQRVFLNNSSGLIEDGRVVRAWGTAIDITERKKTEAALSQSKDFNTAILNTIEDHMGKGVKSLIDLFSANQIFTVMLIEPVGSQFFLPW